MAPGAVQALTDKQMEAFPDLDRFIVLDPPGIW
jgi:hypothetical protein